MPMPTCYEVRKLIVVDAKDHVMGRLAATVAKHLTMGSKVIVLRCERIVMAGDLLWSKAKMASYRRKTMNTNPLKGQKSNTPPDQMFYRIVRGMMPHRKWSGRQRMRRLQCHVGIPPRFWELPKLRLRNAYRQIRLDPNRAYTSLGRLMTAFGWKHGKLMVKLEDQRRIKLAQTHKIRMEVGKMRKLAQKQVGKEMIDGDDRADYEWLVQYETYLSTPKQLMKLDEKYGQGKEVLHHKVEPKQDNNLRAWHKDQGVAPYASQGKE